jgi:hypothetical protein
MAAIATRWLAMAVSYLGITEHAALAAMPISTQPSVEA